MPGPHFRYFSKLCACRGEGLATRACVLVKRYFGGDRKRPFFEYRCTKCGHALGTQVPHRLARDVPTFDSASWMASAVEPSVGEYSSRFAQLPGVIEHLAMSPPGVGELDDRPIVQPGVESRYYFIDEAGDLTLFNRRGDVMVGQPGCSRYFMLGVAIIEDRRQVEQALAVLRASIVSMPELQGVPSLKGTRECFHACKDHRIVREHVMRVIEPLPVKACVIVRDKQSIASQAKAQFKARGIRFKDTDVYDKMVTTLVKDRLHQAEHSQFVIARRGKSERREHLEAAVQHAKSMYENKWGVSIAGRASIATATPDKHAGLQIIDYLLWAVQRFFERDDAVALAKLQRKFSLIIDRDDRSRQPTGEYYTTKNLILERKKKPSEG